MPTYVNIELPVVPATTAPIADNPNTAALRSGEVGTATQFARADHRHPITRQSLPATQPTPVFSGVAGATATVSAPRTWTDEESIIYGWRIRVDIPAGVAGWNRFTFPNVAGYQLPRIVSNGVYRSSGNPETDNGINGAQSEQPTMIGGSTAWDSVNLYVGNSGAKDEPTTQYVMVQAIYTRS